jgi:hypothetical protein
MKSKNNEDKFRKWSRILIFINVFVIILSKVFLDVYEYLPLVLKPQQFAPNLTEATSFKQFSQLENYTESEYTLYNEFGELQIKVANVDKTVGLLELNQSLNNTHNAEVSTKNLTVFYEADLETTAGSFNNKLGSSDDTVEIPSPYYEERFSTLTVNNLGDDEDVSLCIKYNGYTKCTTNINGNKYPLVKTIKTLDMEKYLLTTDNTFSAITYTLSTDQGSKTILPSISYKTGIVGDLNFDGEYTSEDSDLLMAIINKKNDEVICDIKFLDLNQDNEVDAEDLVVLKDWIEEPDNATPIAVSGITIKVIYN